MPRCSIHSVVPFQGVKSVSTQANILATKEFDPHRGCQIQSTGLLGGLYMLFLCATFVFFEMNVLKSGGPKIAEIFTWFPAWFPDTMHFKSVSRAYYEISFMLVLCFSFMVNWEFMRNPFSRLATVAVAIVSVWASWQVAFGADWFFAVDTSLRFGWVWTRIEVIYVSSLLGFIVIGILTLLVQKNRLVVSPVNWALRSAVYRWGAGLLAFTLLLLVVFQHPFYQNTYYENWRITCGYLYSLFFILGLPYAFITNLLRGHKFENRSDPNFVLLLLLRRGWHRLLTIWPRRTINYCHWSLRNRRIGVVIRDLLVKLFFIPLMVTFLFIEFRGFAENFISYWYSRGEEAPWKVSFDFFYGTYFHGLFLMDVSIGLIGYASSSRWLNNKSKSVDPTLLGWFVALACYPPFNSIMAEYLPYTGMGTGESYALFQPMWVDVLLKGITLICFTLYVWSTTAFGLRFSNLTNRGIITRGPYSIVRHPAYMAKNIAWWTEFVRSFHSPWQFIFLAVWNYIYYMRALTEERHLRDDPDYLAYCKVVKYRFIPGWR